MSARVAGTTSFRPIPSYTTLRDVTVWGRDQLRTGEMWNSNSVIAWVIARSGIDAESIQPPKRGRAPGWQAGLAVAHRKDGESTTAPNSKQADADR